VGASGRRNAVEGGVLVLALQADAAQRQRRQRAAPSLHIALAAQQRSAGRTDGSWFEWRTGAHRAEAATAAAEGAPALASAAYGAGRNDTRRTARSIFVYRRYRYKSFFFFFFFFFCFVIL